MPLVTFVTRNNQKQPPGWEEDADVICGVNVGRNESRPRSNISDFKSFNSHME